MSIVKLPNCYAVDKVRLWTVTEHCVLADTNVYQSEHVFGQMNYYKIDDVEFIEKVS